MSWRKDIEQNTTHIYVHTLHWRHNGRDGVSNHQPYECLLNRWFRPRSKKTSKLRVTGFCEGNSPGTGEFPAQMASNAKNVSIWWRHHALASWRLKSPVHRPFIQQVIDDKVTPNYTLLALCDRKRRWPTDSPQKGPQMLKMFSCHEFIMSWNAQYQWFLASIISPFYTTSSGNCPAIISIY